MSASVPASFADATACDVCGHKSIVADAAVCERCARAREAAPAPESPRLLRPVEWEGGGAHPLAAEAVARMREGRGKAAGARITRVFLVANYVLEDVFRGCLEQMQREAKPTGTLRAFHGTDRRSAGAIARTNFDMRFAGRHGQVHGAGIYFSTTAGYSTAYAKLDAQGAQCMFYAEVAPGRVGAFDPGNPAKNDSVSSSNIRVMFRAQQTLPLVLIYFEAAR